MAAAAAAVRGGRRCLPRCLPRGGARARGARARAPARRYAGRRGAAAASGAAAATPPAGAGTGVALEALEWDNALARALPADPSEVNKTRQVFGAAYTRVRPTPASAPRTLGVSAAACELIGLDPDEGTRPEFAEAFAGNIVLAGSEPYANCYGGHQFGTWAGQLGDGRAISLGSVRGPVGAAAAGADSGGAGGLVELQLKGAGLTPYSRRADGRAVLRSSLREFVGSEAMHALGVPTTRALSLVATGDGVLRDMFYNGNARLEPGAVVCRMAPSFVRFGSFELPAARKDEALMRAIADHVIAQHFPHLAAVEEGRERYGAWLDEVTASSARLAARWQSVGFTHGVLNTDNMSVHGVTIDFGPYAFMEAFDPNFTPNSSDSTRRYSFGAQPNIVAENCVRLAMALEPLLGADKAANTERAADVFERTFYESWHDELRKKLGLGRFVEGRDDQLAVGLFTLMARARADYTNTWRLLARVGEGMSAAEAFDQIRPALGAHGLDFVSLEGDDINEANEDPAEQVEAAGVAWMARYLDRIAEDDALSGEERAALMRASSPKYVPRNHLMQRAIEAAEAGDVGPLDRLMEVMTRPYDEQPDAEAEGYCSPAAREDLRAGVTVLS